MTISFSHRVRVPDDVLVSTLQTESVILNLKSERYFGLDEVGTRMLAILSKSDSIQAAYDTLLEEYEVEGDVLKRDLIVLIERLVGQGVLEIARGETAEP